MGTATYPKENGWNAFLSNHGGSDNGETDAASTVFYFDVKHDHLKPALDRFGSFFSCPLLKWSGSKREVNAIDSEFQQAQQNDTCRVEQLISHCSDDGHVYRRFGWGNRKSLVEMPKADGTDVRGALQAFHRKYYSTNLMSLVILGKEPLDTLQQWAVSAFGDSPNHRIERPLATTDKLPIAPSRLPMWLRALPLVQSRMLGLVWYLPSQISRDHVKCKPCDLIGHLIGHEGSGSILSYLKKKGLATSLSAGLEDGDSTAAAALFKVGIELTVAGVQQVDHIVVAVLSYIGMLSSIEGGPPVWCWEEVKNIAELNFRYADEAHGIEYARGLALSMLQRHPPKQTLSADMLYEEYIPALAQEVVAHLTPSLMIGLTYVREDDSNEPAAAAVEPPSAPMENGSGSGENGTARLPATVTVLKPGGKRVQNVGRCMCSPEQKASGQHIEACFKPPPEETAEEYDQVEPWFDVRYAQVPIASEQLKRWQAAYDEGAKAGLTSPRSSSQVISDDAPMPSHFSLPKRNEFLPTDFELRGSPSSSDDAEEASRQAKAPTAAAAACDDRRLLLLPSQLSLEDSKSDTVARHHLPQP